MFRSANGAGDATGDDGSQGLCEDLDRERPGHRAGLLLRREVALARLDLKLKVVKRREIHGNQALNVHQDQAASK